jgi:hypothetical protein
MKRRLLPILSVLSLLLGVAIVVLWVASYWRADQLGWVSAAAHPEGGQRRTLSCGSSHGLLWIGWWRETVSPVGGGPKPRPGDWGYSLPANWGNSVPPYWGWETSRSRWRSPFATHLGFGWQNSFWQQAGRTESSCVVVSPHWALLLLTMALPTAWLICGRKDRQRRLRQSLDLCTACGYDLRASAERCPECGTQIPAGPSRRPMT